MTIGADNRTRVLWNYIDGTAALWWINTPSQFVYEIYGPYNGGGP